MPRWSSLVLLLSGVALYGIGQTSGGSLALILAMGCELILWKRAGDRLRSAIATRRLRRLER